MRATKKKNTVTINGRTYDTSSGRLVDDVVRVTHAARPKSKPTRQIAVTSRDQPAGQTIHVARHTSAHQPEKAKTLMRASVKRPTKHKPVHAVAGVTTQPKHVIINRGVSKKTSGLGQTHIKSQHISKFAPARPIAKRTAHIPVVQAPNHNHRYDINDVPPAPVYQAKTLKEQHEDLFTKAIQNATSHQAAQYVLPKRRHYKVSLLAASVSFILLIGFYSYQNAPKLALMRASSTIGFNARVPKYQPAGFRLNTAVEYHPGKVSLQFLSNSDSRNYSLTQISLPNQGSDVASSFLHGHDYQTVNSGDQTSYIYDQTNIMWFRSGVWYNLVNHAKLSSSQLVDIANSL